MKERPILFSGSMVRAILDGRKTMTRTVVVPGSLKPNVRALRWENCDANELMLTHKCPFGVPGDRQRINVQMLPEVDIEIVSVRVERLQDISGADLVGEGWPGASEVERGCEGPEAGPYQGVTRGDLLRGGVESPDTAVDWFADVWDTINGEGAWALNPWVWVVEFKVVKPETAGGG